MTTDLMPIEPESLIVCPATIDGAACAVILNRHLEKVFNTIFLPENSVSDIFDYPVAKENKNHRRLFVAGFAFPENVVDTDRFRDFRFLSWYSHHFWSKNSLDYFSAQKWDATVNWNYSGTSGLLIDEMHINDPVSLDFTDSLFRRLFTDSGSYINWFYAFLAVKSDLYGIRKLLKPLFEAKDVAHEPDQGLVDEGKSLYESFRQMIETGSQHVFEFGKKSYKACVLPIPGSMVNDYRIMALLAMDILKTQISILIIDGTNQLILIKDYRNTALNSMQEISNVLDEKIRGAAVRLYDKNTLTVSSEEIRIEKLVDSISDAISAKF